MDDTSDWLLTLVDFQGNVKVGPFAAESCSLVYSPATGLYLMRQCVFNGCRLVLFDCYCGQRALAARDALQNEILFL